MIQLNDRILYFVREVNKLKSIEHQLLCYNELNKINHSYVHVKCMYNVLKDNYNFELLEAVVCLFQNKLKMYALDQGLSFWQDIVSLLKNRGSFKIFLNNLFSIRISLSNRHITINNEFCFIQTFLHYISNTKDWNVEDAVCFIQKVYRTGQGNIFLQHLFGLLGKEATDEIAMDKLAQSFSLLQEVDPNTFKKFYLQSCCVIQNTYANRLSPLKATTKYMKLVKNPIKKILYTVLFKWKSSFFATICLLENIDISSLNPEDILLTFVINVSKIDYIQQYSVEQQSKHLHYFMFILGTINDKQLHLRLIKLFKADNFLNSSRMSVRVNAFVLLQKLGAGLKLSNTCAFKELELYEEQNRFAEGSYHYLQATLERIYYDKRTPLAINLLPKNDDINNSVSRQSRLNAWGDVIENEDDSDDEDIVIETNYVFNRFNPSASLANLKFCLEALEQTDDSERHILALFAVEEKIKGDPFELTIYALPLTRVLINLSNTFSLKEKDFFDRRINAIRSIASLKPGIVTPELIKIFFSNTTVSIRLEICDIFYLFCKELTSIKQANLVRQNVRGKLDIVNEFNALAYSSIVPFFRLNSNLIQVLSLNELLRVIFIETIAFMISSMSDSYLQLKVLMSIREEVLEFWCFTDENTKCALILLLGLYFHVKPSDRYQNLLKFQVKVYNILLKITNGSDKESAHIASKITTSLCYFKTVCSVYDQSTILAQ